MKSQTAEKYKFIIGILGEKKVDELYYRPAEIDSLVGDSAKARRVLGWQPRTTFHALVEEMVTADLAIAQIAGDSARTGVAGPSSGAGRGEPAAPAQAVCTAAAAQIRRQERQHRRAVRLF